MLIARTIGPERIELADVPAPAPAAGHALVRVHHVSLCGTDLHIWEDDYPTELPLVQGHEFAGVVESVGPNRQGFAAGDRVAVSPLVYCGECRTCRMGRFNVCESISCLGCYQDGAFAELMSVPVEKLCRVPEELALELAPLGEPASIALQAVNRGRPVAGETALVLGSGPIGLFAALSLADQGLTVLCADTDPVRLELARSFGAAQVLPVVPGTAFPDPGQAGELAALGWAPALVIEATGVPASLENAVRVAAPAGRIVQVGISTGTAALPMTDLPFKELDLLGSRNSLNLIPAGLELLARHRQQVQALVTHRFGLEDLQQAFRTMQDRTQKTGKVMIDMPAARRRRQPARTGAEATA
jgi:L-gulonate 5-dehydrogenase